MNPVVSQLLENIKSGAYKKVNGPYEEKYTYSGSARTTYQIIFNKFTIYVYGYGFSAEISDGLSGKKMPISWMDWYKISDAIKNKEENLLIAEMKKSVNDKQTEIVNKMFGEAEKIDMKAYNMKHPLVEQLLVNIRNDAYTSLEEPIHVSDNQVNYYINFDDFKIKIIDHVIGAIIKNSINDDKIPITIKDFMELKLLILEKIASKGEDVLVLKLKKVFADKLKPPRESIPEQYLETEKF